MTEHTQSVLDRLNKLWMDLLQAYPDGVSNTSTTKYNDIRSFLANLLGIDVAEVYATGAKTRTSNLDTRLVQGNQAGRHTKVGAAFMQVDNPSSDLERLADSSVVTARKFVDGTDVNSYDCILVFVESAGRLQLKRVIERGPDGFFAVLSAHFPSAVLVMVGNASRVAAGGEANRDSGRGDSALDALVKAFVADAKSAGFLFSPGTVRRLVASLMAKKFLILTGLSGSGKTKLAQAFARWMTSPRASEDPFIPGARLDAARTVYEVTDSDRLGVECVSPEGTKVLLPRAIIEQWASFIADNEVPDTVGAQVLRDRIKSSGVSEHSAYLQNFETHYKAAAFALLRARTTPSRNSGSALVPVGADWTGSENVLGYPNGLDERDYVLKPALELILQAVANPGVPHFLILDEMNLSHVERYFGDILSIMESGGELCLYSGERGNPSTWRKAGGKTTVPPVVKQLPANLFLVGTVNVDETTYMFSPKVLDRANVIEFRIEVGEMNHCLESSVSPDLFPLDGLGAAWAGAFVGASLKPADLAPTVNVKFQAEMLRFFSVLANDGGEFGFRTVHEARRFLYFFALLSGPPEQASDFNQAFDCVVLQKILPKLHGSKAKLGPVLRSLWLLCARDPSTRTGDAAAETEVSARVEEPRVPVPAGSPYPLSAEKIARMWRLLNENGFASFAES